jgi:hypothetical protein
MSTILWVLGAICAVVYLASVLFFDRLDGLGLVAFVLIVLAIVTDRSLGKRAVKPPHS